MQVLLRLNNQYTLKSLDDNVLQVPLNGKDYQGIMTPRSQLDKLQQALYSETELKRWTSLTLPVIRFSDGYIHS